MNECIFCKIIAGEVPSYKVYEDDKTFAFFDIYPANGFHTLVIPKNHYRDIYDIPAEDLTAIMATVKKITTLYKEKLGIENVQIINSSGSQAQQDVFHIHFHIVPRETGDGQDIHWKTHPELVEKYGDMLERLKM